MTEKILDKMVEDITAIEPNPAVTLVVVDEFGGVKMMELVGGTELVSILSMASKSEDFPVHKDDYLIDCVGQDIYVVESYDYIRSISGAFLHVNWERTKEILRLCEKEGLKFSLVVSY